MLRNRVLLISALAVAMVLLLELAGILVGLRLERAFSESHDWTREASLNLEFDALLVRAAGEGASAVLSTSEGYAEEALEALEEARQRLGRLRAADRTEDALDAQSHPLRELQSAVLEVLTKALAPLDALGEGAADDLSASERVDAIYGYEDLLPALRAASAQFERSARDLASQKLAKWRSYADMLGIGRLIALITLVLLLTRTLQNRVVSPVRELSAAAQKVSAGDFSTRVGERADFELGDLQRTFNLMAGRLDEYREEATKREADLRDALANAEAASEAKSTFVAGVSHELRTPMHGVLGTADLLLMSSLEDGQRSRVEDIRRSAEALLAIINDVLDLARLEAGRLEIHFSPIAIRPQVVETVEPLESQALSRGLELHWEVAPDVPEWVLGDAGRLRQVLVNLIGNAIKFTTTGSVELKVSPEGFDGQRLLFEVSDTGPGISPASLERIFQPFEQGDRSISRQQGGTGLGLAICRLLVGAMGGKLEVDSKPGTGSRFWFSLPMPSCESPPQAPPSPALPVGGFRGRILVAEDHPVNQTLVAAMLEALGCGCDLVGDGREALAAVERQDYDLVLMDCQMPRLDGLAATRMIRAREQGQPRRTVIVAMTAGAMQSDRKAALSAGMDDFLSKPFTVEGLGRILSRWLVSV